MGDAAIVGLALKDGKNLEAALRIGDSLEEIRLHVVSAFLASIQDRLKEWARNRGEEWEVRSNWNGKNWIERPAEKYLPIILRKGSWPAMVGAVIQADWSGLATVIIGAAAPTREAWKGKDGGAGNVQFYGSEINFVGEQSVNRITKKIAPQGKSPDSQAWWAHWDRLTDSTGQIICNWRARGTICRLHSEKDPLSEVIVDKLTHIASDMDSLVIDET